MLPHLLYSVTLQCTKDAQIIVVIARDATLPNIDLELITFLGDDQICKPVGITSAFAIFQFPASACGTLMTVRIVTHMVLELDSFFCQVVIKIEILPTYCRRSLVL